MKIAVIGAAGMVGSEMVAEAAARGHQVHGYTRSGRSVGDTPTQSLDFNNTDAVMEVINSSEATVISVAGRDDYDAVVNAHQRLIAAAPAGRLLVVGGAGALQAGDGLLLDSPDFPAEYLPEAKSFAQVFADYSASNSAQWTMIAPSPEIAPGVRTGKYLIAENTPAGGFVSTQDFAVAALDEIENPAHRGARFTVASADETAARG
ncbi:NAD(P)-dependent oxidoreductase [Kocuria sp.]|uniref:NAD(P)-dependent oxidoreductase n=1 Tax=Kocuria sp. TaxID=1871328 RepID=UPI0026DF4797|nr:NAD(P)H-binding protein [Kocuria sp.]MDO5617238.1 NAD(P)H-binding protein [Kocuria sp.]